MDLGPTKIFKKNFFESFISFLELCKTRLPSWSSGDELLEVGIQTIDSMNMLNQP